MKPSFRLRMIMKQRAEQRQRYALLAGICVVAMAFLVYFITQIEPVQKKYLYPYPYQDLVQQYAAKEHIESALVASVIMNESKFKNTVHSHRGAIGLMQLMPETAEWIAGQIDDTSFSVDKLHEPETNIRYGVWYLASLEREFNGNEVLALAAYNAGRGNVHEWMDACGWTMEFCHIEEIPYQETRAYVASVLRNKVKYEQLYPEP